MTADARRGDEEEQGTDDPGRPRDMPPDEVGVLAFEGLRKGGGSLVPRSLLEFLE